MSPDDARDFWHVNSMVNPDQILDWTKQVITPIEEAKYNKPAAPGDPNG